MKISFFVLLTLLSISTVAQNRRILCFDIKNSKVDTLAAIDFDTTVIQEETNYYIGNFDNNYSPLNQTPPNENTFPDSQFTLKSRASLVYDINNYPLRTSVKLLSLKNDTLKSRCSGSMISKRHVLTACHCVAFKYKDSLFLDTILVSPVFDDGEYNPYFKFSRISKIYFFENWNFTDSDFAILELDRPIGEKTGWISIGFNANDADLLDGIFYKFSYPAKTYLMLDSTIYNGDTLFYSYGLADEARENNLLVHHANGIPGESGSSFIKIRNGQQYTSYGVLTYSSNLNHSRLTNWKYYAIKSILQKDLEMNDIPDKTPDIVRIYPNPVIDKIQIEYSEKIDVIDFKVYDTSGRLLIQKKWNKMIQEIDLSSLQNGIYVLIFNANNTNIVKKIMKSGS
ncbi:MAG: T9SS type A sorting domain-containing protein [Bacteroidales bacterium]|nr:T9SS type A sorting domain-containing protein [Bacteroidales bacterium]